MGGREGEIPYFLYKINFETAALYLNTYVCMSMYYTYTHTHSEL